MIKRNCLKSDHRKSGECDCPTPEPTAKELAPKVTRERRSRWQNEMMHPSADGKFRGLAVGGPMAGASLVNSVPMIKAQIRKPVEGSPVDQLMAGAPPVESFEYHHVKGVSYGEWTMDFWVPRECTAAWAMSQLVRGYINASKGNQA